MKKIFLAIALLLLTIPAFGAEVAIGANLNALKKAKQAVDLLADIQAGGININDCSFCDHDLIEWAQEQVTHIVYLPDDPSNEEINTALAGLIDDPDGVLWWIETSPAITCADLDNAVLITKNLCERFDEPTLARSARVEAGVSMRGSCDIDVVHRILCN